MLMEGIAKRFYIAAFHGLQQTSSALGFGLASYRQPTRLGDMEMVRELKRKREMLLTPLEAAQLIYLVRATAKLGGHIAEVGVYRGASARLIRESDQSRPLHLFDTFTGLPPTSETDTEFRLGRFEQGQFSCSLEDVQQYLQDLHNVEFHPGFFPDTGAALANERFSFVHLDVDLYESSKSALEWFYPRMLKGGIIITHDFASCVGPRKAMTEFFEQHLEPVIELPGDQGMIVKL